MKSRSPSTGGKPGDLGALMNCSESGGVGDRPRIPVPSSKHFLVLIICPHEAMPGRACVWSNRCGESRWIVFREPCFGGRRREERVCVGRRKSCLIRSFVGDMLRSHVG
jgi:hypothetical protein